ncbi:hypothetical protein QVD17_16117 [Tagetes erecta]|uniref:Uncharacterized protein n=1 Tax=Tagetes erecta TaxID=13708 RepID=A0AAD8KUJ2_TARER|nr:hypothetical protein QVD17_16117 [Tagetes erecta]
MLDEYDETMKAMQICIWELREGIINFLQMGKKIMNEPLKSYASESEYEGDDEDEGISLISSHESSNQTQVEVEEEPTIALVTALANASRDKDMDQTEKPVLRNVEAIKRFMRSSRKCHLVV